MWNSAPARPLEGLVASTFFTIREYLSCVVVVGDNSPRITFCTELAGCEELPEPVKLYR